MIFTSEAAGSRTQKPRAAAVKAVRQCAQNQKLKIPTNTSRTHWKTSCTTTKPNGRMFCIKPIKKINVPSGLY